MKDIIGLVLAHHVTNYGALLQAFAVQTAVESLGFETKIIDYQSNKFRRGLKLDIGLLQWFWNNFMNSRQKKKIDPILDDFHKNNRRERKERFHEFNTGMLHHIVKCKGVNALENVAGECKAVIIGSDQMWLPGVSFGVYHSLRFVPKDVRRISYATSLGVSNYPGYCYRSARDMWSNIDFLSVREEQGKKIIDEVAPGLDVNVVLDPTYLFDKKDWAKYIPVKKMTDDKYVLCYFLGNSEKQQLMAKEFAERKGLKCYSILSDESVSAVDTKFPDHIITGASVQDFVNWIRGAEFMITDSFHGLAFSIINERQFFVFYRQRLDVKESRNSRIDNILSMAGCENRLVSNSENQIPDLEPIDYNTVNQNISEYRDKSWEFLRSALAF